MGNHGAIASAAESAVRFLQSCAVGARVCDRTVLGSVAPTRIRPWRTPAQVIHRRGWCVLVCRYTLRADELHMSVKVCNISDRTIELSASIQSYASHLFCMCARAGRRLRRWAPVPVPVRARACLCVYVSVCVLSAFCVVRACACSCIWLEGDADLRHAI